ncbi:biliverdin-producing heme oxygenase [Cyanobacteria bacterium FACHB-DQ100]|nr:biliverdin-producing heme oxygenase [Cyanobacteria bacterium FACHB-DQ100]
MVSVAIQVKLTVCFKHSPSHANHPIIGAIVFPELHRTANLERDLAFFYGDNWREEIAPLPAGQIYVDRLREISNTELNIECDRSYSKSPRMGDLGGENLSHPQINLV